MKWNDQLILVLIVTWERKNSAWEKLLLCRSSFRALFLNASASKLLFAIVSMFLLALAPSEFETPPPRRRLSSTSATRTSTARAVVPQWATKVAAGSATRLGPAPQRPKQPEDLTATLEGARAVRVSRVWKEPCLRQVRLVHTLISLIWMSSSASADEEEWEPLMVELVMATIRRRLKYDVAAAVEEERPQRDLLLDPEPGRGNTTTSISRFAWFAPLLEPCHVPHSQLIITTTFTNLPFFIILPTYDFDLLCALCYAEPVQTIIPWLY